MHIFPKTSLNTFPLDTYLPENLLKYFSIKYLFFWKPVYYEINKIEHNLIKKHL
jgi:hypothetical protein